MAMMRRRFTIWYWMSCVRLRAAYIQRSSYEPLQPTIFLHLIFFQTETTTWQKLWTSRGLGAVSG